MSEAYRLATESDLPALVALLADDPLGATRETAGADLHPDYRAAFHAIDRDPHHELILAESGDRIVGMLQLSFLPNLTYHGGWRAQIESVRIAR